MGQEILLHAGNIFDYQNPKLLWPMLRTEIDNGRDLRIVFVGTVSPGIRRSIQEAGLSDRTEYKGFLPYGKMIEEISSASFLLVCATEKRHVPGKLFEYLRSGKPILAFGEDNEEVKKILSDANAGMMLPLTADGREFFVQAHNFHTNAGHVQQYERKEIARQLSKLLP
jgi:glycosyltransferase involved in cell wall biosynthesis